MKAANNNFTTFYVVQPFLRRGAADVVPGDAYEAPSASLAVKRAQALSAETVGAIAFSRSGDLSSGEFDDAVILGMYGTIPDEALDAIRDGTA